MKLLHQKKRKLDDNDLDNLCNDFNKKLRTTHIQPVRRTLPDFFKKQRVVNEEEKIVDLEDDVNSLEERVAELRNEIEDLEGTANELKEQISSYEEETITEKIRMFVGL